MTDERLQQIEQLRAEIRELRKRITQINSDQCEADAEIIEMGREFFGATVDGDSNDVPGAVGVAEMMAHEIRRLRELAAKKRFDAEGYVCGTNCEVVVLKCLACGSQIDVSRADYFAGKYDK